MRVATVAVVSMFAGAPMAHAQAPHSGYGNWFGYGERGDLIVMTVKSRPGLTIACKQGALSLSLLSTEARDDGLTPGEELSVRFQAGRSAPIEARGRALNVRSLDLTDAPAIVRQIRDARRVSFHITTTSGKRFVRNYDVVGAPRALGEIAASCPF